EAPVIWSAGTTKLRDYHPAGADLPVILVIPSLINRLDILDIDASHSLLRTLAAEGFRPLVVDWDIPGDEEEGFSLDDYMTKRLLPVFDRLTGAEKVHVFGYCMGGLLALALAALRPERTATLTLLATPWDFHKPDPAQGQIFQHLARQMKEGVDAI